MAINQDELFDDGGLDLTSEPASFKQLAPNTATNNTASNPSGLTHVQVHFRCCKVYWRFPIPADILSGAKSSWFVYCPRCGSKLQLP